MRFRAFFWVTLLPLTAAAQQPGPADYKSMSLEQLSQIDVTTPSREPVSAFQTPAAIYVITSDDIRRSGATSIPEALRLAPSVEVARIDSDKWSIGIRGFGTRLTRSVLVLIDGRTVYTTLFDGTYWEVQDTNMEDIDRIEVIRGPGGTIWGPNAVNGVINVITRRPSETKGMQATAGGGNFERAFGSYRYGGGNGSDFSYRFYGKGFDRGPEYHQDGDNFDAWREGQGGFRMEWDEADGNDFNLQGDIYIERAGERVQATMYTPPYSQNVDGTEDLSGGNLLGRWVRKLKNGGDLQIQTYYDRTNRWEPNLAYKADTYDADLVEHLHLPWREQITWGLGARFIHAYNPVVVTGLQFAPPERTDDLITGFFQDEIGLIENRLSLTVGAKLLHTNFADFETEPSARLMWSPSKKDALWTAFTHAARTASDAEENFYLLGSTGLDINGLPLLARFNPNPHFAPELMNGYELGYRHLFGKKVSVDIASFYNHYHDLFDEEFAGPIYLEDNPTPIHYLLPALFGNGLYGYTKGVEVAPEWRITDRWRLRGSYSFLHMNIGRSPGSGDIGTAPGIVGASPQHEAWVQSSYDFTKTVHLDLTYRYVSTLFAASQMVPDYSTGDVRFAWQFRPSWEWSVVGQNLLQPWHAEYNGDPGPLVGIRRNGYVKLTWTH